MLLATTMYTKDSSNYCAYQMWLNRAQFLPALLNILILNPHFPCIGFYLNDKQ